MMRNRVSKTVQNDLPTRSVPPQKKNAAASGQPIACSRQAGLKLRLRRENVHPASDMVDWPPGVLGELIRSVHVQKKNDPREVLKTAAPPQEKKNAIADIQRHAKTRTFKKNNKPES